MLVFEELHWPGPEKLPIGVSRAGRQSKMVRRTSGIRSKERKDSTVLCTLLT